MSSRPGISSPSRLEALTRPLSCLLEPFSRRRCIIALSRPGSPPEAARAPPVKVVSKCALAGSPRPPSQARIEPASPGRRSLSLSGSFSGEKSFEKFPAYIKAAPPRSMVPHGLQLLEGGLIPGLVLRCFPCGSPAVPALIGRRDLNTPSLNFPEIFAALLRGLPFMACKNKSSSSRFCGQKAAKSGKKDMKKAEALRSPPCCPGFLRAIIPLSSPGEIPGAGAFPLP